jgi:hypothetical protein
MYSEDLELHHFFLQSAWKNHLRDKSIDLELVEVGSDAKRDGVSIFIGVFGGPAAISGSRPS